MIYPGSKILQLDNASLSKASRACTVLWTLAVEVLYTGNVKIVLSDHKLCYVVSSQKGMFTLVQRFAPHLTLIVKSDEGSQELFQEALSFLVAAPLKSLLLGSTEDSYQHRQAHISALDAVSWKVLKRILTHEETGKVLRSNLRHVKLPMYNREAGLGQHKRVLLSCDPTRMSQLRYNLPFQGHWLDY